MSLKPPSTSANAGRLAPVEPSHAPLFCFALLTISCGFASFALACATPFAAFAVMAAAMLPLRPALLVVAGALLVNQGIGFGALHYPKSMNTVLWGLAIGLAALAATVISATVLRSLSQSRAHLAMAIALACGYGAYELVILAATPFLGGAGSFTVATVSRIGFLNVAWLIALIAVCEILRLLNPIGPGRTVT